MFSSSRFPFTNVLSTRKLLLQTFPMNQQKYITMYLHLITYVKLLQWITIFIILSFLHTWNASCPFKHFMHMFPHVPHKSLLLAHQCELHLLHISAWHYGIHPKPEFHTTTTQQQHAQWRKHTQWDTHMLDTHLHY